jgi:hypothetical protein
MEGIGRKMVKRLLGIGLWRRGLKGLDKVCNLSSSSDRWTDVARIEHLLCLSRGIDMGPKWFEEKLNDLGKKIKNIAGIPHDTVTTTTTTSDAPNKLDKEDKLRIECWFGDKDGMVPLKGQGESFTIIITRTGAECQRLAEWLNKILSTREEIDYTVHKVKGGTHNDL